MCGGPPEVRTGVTITACTEDEARELVENRSCDVATGELGTVSDGLCPVGLSAGGADW